MAKRKELIKRQRADEQAYVELLYQNPSPAEASSESALPTVSIEPPRPVEPSEYDDMQVTVLMDEVPEGVFDIGLYSYIGTRKSQQDSCVAFGGNVQPLSDPKKCFAVLCDGMGGLSGGERASGLSVEKFCQDFLAEPQIDDYPEFIASEIKAIDKSVSELKDANGKALGAGSTFTTVIIDDNNLYWGSVGDSHIYIIRNQEIEMPIREHNYMLMLQERVIRGELSQEEANSDPRKGALISYIGMNGISLMDVNLKPFKLLRGDYVLLCSDGLYRILSDQQIRYIVTNSGKNMSETARSLVETATRLNVGSQDNTTVVIIKYI